MSFLTSQATLEAKEAVKMAAQTQNLTAGGGGGCFVKGGGFGHGVNSWIVY